MWKDPIVAEVRQVREAHAAQFNNDLLAIYHDLKKQEQNSHRRFVSYPARRTPRQKKHPQWSFWGMKNLDSVEIELLSDVHLPDALRLTEQSQWNQTERDWRRLLQLSPRGCFGAGLAGRLIGTVTTVAYGTELAWIGMMLVDPDNHHRGLGTRLMQKALEHLRADGVASIKLDATPAGRPLYESRGFRSEGLVERWEGMGQPGVKKKLAALG